MALVFGGFCSRICWIAGIWLASLPDKSFLEDVRGLVAALQKLDPVKNGSQSAGRPALQETWQCSCGKMNKMADSNCPECGLKRDFLLSKKA